ncbi:MAG: hypothetical protein ABFR33_05895 [Verrucomicrobiota bacterium]
MRMRIAFLFQLGIVLLLCGCTTPEQPAVVVMEDETKLHPGAQVRPKNLLFPEYLFMADFELDQHGRIPGSSVIGADLKTELDLKTTRQRFSSVLASNGWAIVKNEVAEQSFRMTAAMKGDALEIRAVQGSGPTQVFILYQPRPGKPL